MTYQPLHRHRPAHKWTNGDLAAKVGADLGLAPDDEQRWILDTIYAEKAVDRPASFEVAVVSPRQNIKTSTLGIAALADLFVFGVERHLWTAHHGDTLKGTFQDFRSWIKSNPEYDDQVTFYEGHQDMSIVHKDTGNTIDFQSRSGKAGRGLTGVKRITLDEALYLEPKHVGAVYPTMLTRPEAQVRIGSSAGLEDSEQLRRIRDRGRSGKDRRLAYVEYGAEVKACLRMDCTHRIVDGVGPEGCALDDRDLWWQANCALWAGRIEEESLLNQRQAMPPAEFKREFLSWWEDPESLGGIIPALPWRDAADASSTPVDRLALGVEVGPDLAWASVALSGLRDDGSWHIALEANQDTHGEGVGWLVPHLTALVTANPQIRCVAADVTGPVKALLEQRGTGERAQWLFTDTKLRVQPIRSADLGATCSSLLSGVVTKEVRHLNQRQLSTPALAAGKRPLADTGLWVWSRRGATTDITPIQAATLALFGAQTAKAIRPLRATGEGRRVITG